MEGPGARPSAHREGAEPSSERGAHDARLGWVLGAACAFYAVYIWRGTVTVGGRRYFTLFDDAMVSMVYARSLADGRGLVWSDGLAVEGYTNPAWTVWMAMVHVVGLEGSGAVLAVSVTGAIILLALAVVAHRLALELSGVAWVGLVAAAAVAFCYPLVFWTLRGMEVGLVALLVTTAALLAVRIQSQPTTRRLVGLGAVLALGVLTRNDALVPAGALVLALLVAPGAARRRSLGVPVAIVGAAMALQVLVRLALYGELVPNTYVLKVEGTTLAERLGRGLTTLEVFALLEAAIPLALVVALLVCRRADRATLTVLAPAGALLVYATYVGGDAWEWTGFANRYLTTALPLLLIVASVAVERLEGGVVTVGVLAALLVAALVAPVDGVVVQMDRGAVEALRTEAALAIGAAIVALIALWRLARPGWTPVVAAAVLVGLANLGALAEWVSSNAALVETWDAEHIALGEASRAATAPDATIAVFGAGTTPYYAERPTVDLLGKSDPVIAAVEPQGPLFPGHNKRDYEYSICERRPDLVLELWAPTDGDRRLLEGCGYRHLRDDLYVRDDSLLVDVDRLLAELDRLLAELDRRADGT